MIEFEQIDWSWIKVFAKNGSYLGDLERFDRHDPWIFDPNGPVLDVEVLRQIADKLDELNRSV